MKGLLYDRGIVYLGEMGKWESGYLGEEGYSFFYRFIEFFVGS